MYNTALRLLVSVSTVSTTTLVSPVVPVAVVIPVEDCSTEEADVELLTMMCLEHAVMSAARSVETLFEAHNLTKQCVKRQQECLQCCRASCILGVESTAEVVHKSAVATRCASEQKENIERCRLLLTDSQTQVCFGEEKEGAEVGAELIPVSTTVLPARNLVDISRKQAVF